MRKKTGISLQLDFRARRISCGNSHDLRPVINAIDETVCEILETLPPDQTLFILFGETHWEPIDIFAQQLILTRLKDRSLKLAFALEQSRNILAEMLKGNISTLAPTGLRINDPYGWRSVKALIPQCEYQAHLPYCKKNLLAACLQKNIPVLFNDAVFMSVAWLDPKDPVTLSWIQKLLEKETKEEKEKIEICNMQHIRGDHRFGMNVRNHMLVTDAIAYAKRFGLRVVLHGIGAAHLPGLIKLYMQKKAAILPIFINNPRMSEGLQRLIPYSIDVRDMPRDWERISLERDFEELEEDEEMMTEQTMLSKISRASGYEHEVRNVDALSKELEIEVDREKDGWIREAELYALHALLNQHSRQISSPQFAR